MNNEQILKEYNLWRRGYSGYEMPDPTLIGIAIDSVLSQLAALKEENERLKAGEASVRDALDGYDNHAEPAHEIVKSIRHRHDSCVDTICDLKARVAELAAPDVQGEVGEGVPDARWLLDQYEAFIAAIPVGQENKTRGASAYNWHRAAKATLESLLAAAPDMQREPLEALSSRLLAKRAEILGRPAPPSPPTASKGVDHER